MPLAGSGGGDTTPTGNALSDANAAAALSAAQIAAVSSAIGATTATGQLTSQGPECLWPPPGLFGASHGFFAGLMGGFGFSVPCLITKSQARAVIGAGWIVGGLLIAWGGFAILGVGPAVTFALGAVGVKGGKKAVAAAPAQSEVALAA